MKTTKILFSAISLGAWAGVLFIVMTGMGPVVEAVWIWVAFTTFVAVFAILLQ